MCIGTILVGIVGYSDYKVANLDNYFKFWPHNDIIEGE